MTPLRFGIIASHGGSNLQAIIDATKTGTKYRKYNDR
jgi:folate-dependent phosphoribosylglycinamide formyltransferase PurN